MTPSDRPKPTDLAIQAHANDIERRDGEVPIDGLALRNVSNPTLHRGEVIAKQANRTTHPGDQMKARLDHRALARTVGTNHRGQHSPRNIEIKIPEDWSTVIRDGHVMDRQGCLWIMLGADGRISMTMMDWHISSLPFHSKPETIATL